MIAQEAALALRSWNGIPEWQGALQISKKARYCNSFLNQRKIA